MFRSSCERCCQSYWTNGIQVQSLTKELQGYVNTVGIWNMKRTLFGNNTYGVQQRTQKRIILRYYYKKTQKRNKLIKIADSSAWVGTLFIRSKHHSEWWWRWVKTLQTENRILTRKRSWSREKGFHGYFRDSFWASEYFSQRSTFPGVQPIGGLNGIPPLFQASRASPSGIKRQPGSGCCQDSVSRESRIASRLPRMETIWKMSMILILSFLCIE